MNKLSKDQITILAYTFPSQGKEVAYFSKLASAIEKTWVHCGKLKTVIVSSHSFLTAKKFAEEHHNVELQIEPSLVPGNIKTMSLDCIKNLHKRFSTPYVLIVQDDGYPVRSGIEEFIGNADFWGAPIISDGWKRKLAYAIGLGSFNGGFSLRSRALCEHASRKWFSVFRYIFKEDSRHLGEDFYYTTLLKLLPSTWFKFRFPSERDSFRFSFDALSGAVTLPSDIKPFGKHGSINAETTILAYHFWNEEGYEKAFAGVRLAIEETWKHCGLLKTVLVVNEAHKCVEVFAAEHQNVEIQVEPSLIPGNIHTMSVDCNSKLYKRFSTPYVLIVQNDGHPLRSGLDEFVGRYDFIGAPYVRDSWWKNKICAHLNSWTQNGGFSLRSRRICEAAAKSWNEKYHTLGECTNSSEDIFYTQFLPRHEKSYRRAFRLATNKESLRFSWDGIVPIPPPKELPFGYHGKNKPY
jgi:hypothetical protein